MSTWPQVKQYHVGEEEPLEIAWWGEHKVLDEAIRTLPVPLGEEETNLQLIQVFVPKKVCTIDKSATLRNIPCITRHRIIDADGDQGYTLAGLQIFAPLVRLLKSHITQEEKTVPRRNMSGSVDYVKIPVIKKGHENRVNVLTSLIHIQWQMIEQRGQNFTSPTYSGKAEAARIEGVQEITPPPKEAPTTIDVGVKFEFQEEEKDGPQSMVSRCKKKASKNKNKNKSSSSNSTSKNTNKTKTKTKNKNKNKS